MENIENKVKKPKINFWKKIWYSIFKLEKYPELSDEGVFRAIKYVIKLSLFMALVVAVIIVVDISFNFDSKIDHLEKEVPNIKYENGSIISDSEVEIVRIEENEINSGYMIIDINTDDADLIENYKKEIAEKKSGILVLKNKVIMVDKGEDNKIATNEIEYKSIIETVFGENMSSISKQDLVNYLKNQGKMYLCIVTFFTYFISYTIIYTIYSISYALVLTLIGYAISLLMKVKLRYSAAFNMSIYAFTLSNILTLIYFAINHYFDIKIKYFQIAYIAIASIYLIAVIFIIKSDFIKKETIKEVEKEVIKDFDDNKKTEENKEDEDKEIDDNVDGQEE